MSALARVLALVALVGCIDTSSVLAPAPGGGVDPAVAAADAVAEFNRSPRTETSVVSAFEWMRDAARATAPGDAARPVRLAAAARYAIWLAQRAEDAGGRSAYAEAAIVLGNTMIEAAPGGVEGYYLRAVAVGLFARENSAYGVDAMGRIRDDALRAIELDDTFDDAGPRRVLGALYLNAPGPPAGVGSLRRAVQELERAARIAPAHPENLLFLAAAYLESGRGVAEVEALLSRASAAIDRSGDTEDRSDWRRQLGELVSRIRSDG